MKFYCKNCGRITRLNIFWPSGGKCEHCNTGMENVHKQWIFFAANCIAGFMALIMLIYFRDNVFLFAFNGKISRWLFIFAFYAAVYYIVRIILIFVIINIYNIIMKHYEK